MTTWYSYTDPSNNTLSNRNLLLSRLTIDPDLSQFLPTAVNNPDPYTIEVVFTNVISDYPDQYILQKIINIIFNFDIPDEISPRSGVSTTSPLPQHDYYSNFVIGSDWWNTTKNLRFECLDNTFNNAIWRIIPYVGTTGTGTGATGSYPYDGSVLQYVDTEKIWVSQPGKYQSLTLYPSNLIPSATPPTIISGLYLFSNGLDQSMYGYFLLPNDYLEGSDIQFNIGFATTTNNPGNVIWAIDYDWKNINDIFSPYAGITGLTNTNSLSDQYLNTQLPSILGTSKSILSTIKFTLTRNGTSDSYPDDVALLYVNLSYITCGTGSSQAFIK